MSLFRTISIECPNCGEIVRMDAVGSVNADRRPDLRDAILNNSFQDTTCGSCEHTFRLQPSFNYLDAGNKQWIAALPAVDFPFYLTKEDETSELFSESYGDKAPQAAQVIGNTLDVRLTFGWPAVREKILARQHEIDDVYLEVMKLDMLRKLPTAPLAPGIELRLGGLTDYELGFNWIRTDTEEVLEAFSTPRGWYQSIVDNPDPWEPVKSKIDDGPFVDMQKVYMGHGRDAAE